MFEMWHDCKKKNLIVMSRHIRVFNEKHTHHSAPSHWRVVIRNIIGVPGIACIAMSWPIVKLGGRCPATRRCI
jgi:hypothetical protein